MIVDISKYYLLDKSKYYIYKITSPSNKIYIGQSTSIKQDLNLIKIYIVKDKVYYINLLLNME